METLVANDTAIAADSVVATGDIHLYYAFCQTRGMPAGSEVERFNKEHQPANLYARLISETKMAGYSAPWIEFILLAQLCINASLTAIAAAGTFKAVPIVLITDQHGFSQGTSVARRRRILLITRSV